MAVMLDTLTQINIDQAIGQFNLEQEKQYKMEQAAAFKRQGKQAMYAGYTGALSSLLQGASSYALYKGTFDSAPQKPQKPQKPQRGTTIKGNIKTSYGITVPSAYIPRS